MELYLGIVIVLAILAISDLVVGVSNDAVNFLNSAIGSKVAPRWVIMIIASVGMLLGVTFSSGMMEVARKGIFNPEKFIMPELLIIFLAVMLTDVILLDLYNTFGLPTSTTVSIVFELLGAAVAVSLLKIHAAGHSAGELINYINTAKALAIISGILASVIIAFITGSIVQFISRSIFTFDFKNRLKRYGGVWGGFALTAITYFILIKGAKGASFITPETLEWIQTHTGLILLLNFILWTLVLQALLLFTRVHILKIIVLIGCGALAMAFAANDLVNFIGVPLAGFSAFNIAGNQANPLEATMEAMRAPVQGKTGILLIAGIVMVVTLWLSRKARTVSKTELSLGRQDEGSERFESTMLSRVLVRMVMSLGEGYNKVVPESWRKKINSRFDQSKYSKYEDSDTSSQQSFDLLRASVNMMVASALISLGTSLKLPLSTTYVTFMVSMGSSLADRAWGSESAVYRITGVLTVIGGWFFTAFMAFTVSCIFATLIYLFHWPAMVGLVLLAAFFLYRTHAYHSGQEKKEKLTYITQVSNAKTADEAYLGINKGLIEYVDHLMLTLENVFSSIFAEDRKGLKKARKQAKASRQQAKDLVSVLLNTTTMPLSEPADELHPKVAQTVSALQETGRTIYELADACYNHVNNNHKGLIDIQKKELNEVKTKLLAFLKDSQKALKDGDGKSLDQLIASENKLDIDFYKLDKNQIKRIKKKESKTRQSMLYFNMLSSSEAIIDQMVRLLRGAITMLKE
ncbi:inorganic phosphate transporter [candidate division KSB1 bacterium]|nr:inorganic phosphate transporter [candidate division KSB1 bacterium]